MKKLPEPPRGWTLLPAKVSLRGKVHPVWPRDGRGYLKDEGNGVLTAVFVWEAENSLMFTVTHSLCELPADRAFAYIKELTGSQALPSIVYPSPQVPVYKLQT